MMYTNNKINKIPNFGKGNRDNWEAVFFFPNNFKFQPIDKF